LVARDYERSEVVCGRVQLLPIEQEPYGIASRETNAKFNPGKTMDIYCHRKVTTK